jgi:hypothetical protein
MAYNINLMLFINAYHYCDDFFLGALEFEDQVKFFFFLWLCSPLWTLAP